MANDTQEDIQTLRKRLKMLEHQISLKKLEHINLFQDKIDDLIGRTPTGDLRNDICDLNILFHSIIQSI